MSPRYAMSPRPAITCAGYPLVSTQLMHESQRSGCWLQQASTKLFSQALAALDTSAGRGGSAPVLGQANTSTRTSRAPCRILLVLSALCILRSHPGFDAAGIAGAKGTRSKPIDNARLYARKAVTEMGLGWVLRRAPASSSCTAIEVRLSAATRRMGKPLARVRGDFPSAACSAACSAGPSKSQCQSSCRCKLCCRDGQAAA